MSLLERYPIAGRSRVHAEYSSEQTNTSVVAAPGADKRLAIVLIAYSGAAAGRLSLVQDPAGTPATKWGPHDHAANSGICVGSDQVPVVVLDENKALGVTTTDTGNHTVDLVVLTLRVYPPWRREPLALPILVRLP